MIKLAQTLPAGLGGVVQDGTYWASGITLYSDPNNPVQPPAGLTVGYTFVISGGTIRQSATADLPGIPEQIIGDAGTLVTSGKTFTITLTCMQSMTVTTGEYTASGNTLLLYIPESASELILVKQ